MFFGVGLYLLLLVVWAHPYPQFPNLSLFSFFLDLFHSVLCSLLLFITFSPKIYRSQDLFRCLDESTMTNFYIFRYQLVDFRVRYRRDGSRDSIAPLRTTELRTLPVQQQRHKVSISLCLLQGFFGSLFRFFIFISSWTMEGLLFSVSAASQMAISWYTKLTSNSKY